MENNSSKTAVRWLVLIVVVVHILYNNFYDVIFPGNSILSVTNKYRSLFVPAGFTFSIWGLIYLLITIYCIYQLLPSQKGKPLYDRIAWPLMTSMFMGIVWGITFRASMITLSMVAILLSLVTAIMCLSRVHESIKSGSYPRTIMLPFSLYAGWLTAASFASLSLWLVSLGWKGGMLGEENWVIVLLIIAALIGFIISYHFYDYVFSLVIAWACFGIYFERKDDVPLIAVSAITCMGFMLAWSVFVFIKSRSRKINTGVI